jgi:hypothetical protein
MQESPRASEDLNAPDILYLLELIQESKVALRSLAAMVPDPDAVEGLYDYVRDALETIDAGLALLTPPPWAASSALARLSAASTGTRRTTMRSPDNAPEIRSSVPLAGAPRS